MTKETRRIAEALERIADIMERYPQTTAEAIAEAVRDPGTVEPRWEVQGRDIVEPEEMEPLAFVVKEWVERAEAARAVLDVNAPVVHDDDPHLDSPDPSEFFAHNVDIPR